VGTNFFNKFSERYSSTISLNKNLLLSGTVGFIVSLVVGQLKECPSERINIIILTTYLTSVLWNKSPSMWLALTKVFFERITKT
jgi:hypothetical protein